MGHRWRCWYLLGLYRDVEELLAEPGIEGDHVTVYRWAQRCTPLLAEAATRIGTGPVTAGGSTKPTSKCLVGGRYVQAAWLVLARPTAGRCPTDCPITPVLWVLLVPLRRNHDKQNA
jgi:hypothetical protein